MPLLNEWCCHLNFKLISKKIWKETCGFAKEFLDVDNDIDKKLGSWDTSHILWMASIAITGIELMESQCGEWAIRKKVLYRQFNSAIASEQF
ncbi:MAG TPA: hypothetical protein V6C57_02110 [Coleofasciculaceae cyanobacterium]